MAWNKPENSKPEASASKRKAFRLPIFCTLAGLIAIICTGALLIYALSSNKSEQEKIGQSSNFIKDAKPSVPKAAPTVAKKVDPYDDYDHEKKYRDERGILRYKKGGARAYDPATLPKSVKIMESSHPSPFKYRSEQLIAGLLTIKPGSMIFGGMRFDESFVEDYEASLKEPIIISESDSAEDKQLKRMMIDTKIELADRIRNGEKLQQILKDTASELRRMAEYKRSLSQELNAMLKNGDASDNDVDDYIAAANKMLVDHGIEPLKNTSLIKRNIRLRKMKGLQ